MSVRLPKIDKLLPQLLANLPGQMTRGQWKRRRWYSCCTNIINFFADAFERDKRERGREDTNSLHRVLVSCILKVVVGYSHRAKRGSTPFVFGRASATLYRATFNLILGFLPPMPPPLPQPPPSYPSRRGTAVCGQNVGCRSPERCLDPSRSGR